MNDNDIIKALEYIVRVAEEIQQCSIAKFVPVSNIKLALDLINRQKAEIERLKSMNQSKLDIIYDVRTDLEIARAEAIEEFAERLKKELHIGCYEHEYLHAYIDMLAKQMAGDES